tara:strand:+ start:79 stop:429 length:351 start_codon:yes stop_codon:yes gene_type:complete
VGVGGKILFWAKENFFFERFFSHTNERTNERTKNELVLLSRFFLLSSKKRERQQKKRKKTPLSPFFLVFFFAPSKKRLLFFCFVRAWDRSRYFFLAELLPIKKISKISFFFIQKSS